MEYVSRLSPNIISNLHVQCACSLWGKATYRVRGDIGYCLLSKAIRKCPEQLAVHVRASRVIWNEITEENGPEIVLSLSRKVFLETHGSLWYERKHSLASWTLIRCQCNIGFFPTHFLGWLPVTSLISELEPPHLKSMILWLCFSCSLPYSAPKLGMVIHLLQRTVEYVERV